MASTWSALKIELLETGQNSGTWGTLTNVNLGDAVLGEAITGQATVDFPSDADVTITLTDSATSQSARNLRLNITESSTGIGSVRNLILGSGCQIEKFYLINNTGTGAKTVKNTSGTGISVPAGKATLVFNNGTNVVDAASYFTSLTLGSALPIASGGTGTTSTTFTNLTTNVTGTLPTANGGTNLGGATPFTSGGVVYASSSSALATGSALTFDGTTPTSSNATGAPNFIFNSNANTPYIRFDQTGASKFTIGESSIVGGGGAGFYDFYAVASVGQRFFTNAAERLRISSAGDVGIGQTSPSVPLDVNRSSATSGLMLNLQNTSTGSFIQFAQPGVANLLFGCPNADAFVWKTFGSGTYPERMRLDASGNLGIGTSSPSNLLSVLSASATATVAKFAATNYGNLGTTYIEIGTEFGDGGSRIGNINPSTNNGTLVFETMTASSGVYAERARIDSSGNLLVGKTSSADTVVGSMIRGSGYITSTWAESTDATTTYHVYSTGASAYRFYVGLGGTIFATSITITAISDQRLKENVRDIDTGLNSIMALKPRRFDWKEGKGQDKKDVAGFIAQEFETVFPECVSTSKAGEDGIEYKNINHETLIPTLVKAMQEQQALITQLQADIATLKG